MTGFVCSEHPDVVAEFSCDACARLLCPACVREGHRLYFCRHCGERAVAFDPAGASSVPDRLREAKIARPYGFAAALAYAFRGSGRFMLPAYVLSLVGVTLVPFFGVVLLLLIWMLIPGLLFEIVRTTAAGETELPDWPDYSELFARVKEAFWMLAIYATAVVPMLVLFYLGDCDPLAALFGSPPPSCRIPWVFGLLLGSTVGVFGFGATGTHSSGWLSFRIDLHLRALLSPAGLDGFKVALLLTALEAASELLAGPFGAIPVVGLAVAAGLSGYALFTSAHLVGLVFRRHAAELDPIYRL